MDAKLQAAMRQVQELTMASYEKQLSFLYHLLLVSSSVLSIVISLHTSNEAPLYIRWVFAIAVILLALGVLACSIALYSQKEIAERGRRKYIDEYTQSLRSGEPHEMTSVGKTRLHKICERLTYILLPAAIVVLAVYAILLAFVA